MSKSICSRLWLGALAFGVASFANAQTMKPEAGQSMLKARPSTFTKNVGQWDQRALFGGHAAGMDFWVSKEGFVFQYQRTNADKGDAKFAGHTVGMLFDGAKPFKAVGTDAAGAKEFMGSTAMGVAAKFRTVKLNGVYDKIDAVAYFDGKAPRYDFIVHAGAKSDDIRFAFKGAAATVVAKDRLQVKTVLGDKFQEGLFAYQTINGKKVSIPVSFKQIDSSHIGFNVGVYDKSKDLVIDPLVYGTYYGGDEGFDEVRGVAADATGNVYITGYTKSPIYPVLYGPFGFNIIAGKDAFVSRLTGDVYVHDYSALIPGTGNDQGDFIKLDSLGNIWVVGDTTSPTIAGDSSPGNMWVLRFRLDATTVLSPFLPATVNPVFFRFGGPTANPDVLSVNSFSIRPDPNGTFGTNVRMMFTGRCKAVGATGLVTGANSGSFYGTVDFNGSTFSLVPGASGFPTTSGPSNGFPTSTTLTGGSFDYNGNFFLSGTLKAVGNTDTAGASPIFATTPGVWLNGRLQRQNDIWVRKYDSNGSMTWSGLVGGADDDHTEGIVTTHTNNVVDIGGNTLGTDPQGNVYIVGRSNSYDYPRTQGVFGEIYVSGKNYITVTKIKGDGTQILYSTNISNNDGLIACSGIGVDSVGNVVITGTVGTHSFYDGAVIDPVQPNDFNPSSASCGLIPLVNPLGDPGSIPYHQYSTPPGYFSTLPIWPQTGTSDAWFMIINPTGSAIVRSSLIGGVLDEGIFAPFVDPNGDIWLCGWIDTHRDYTIFTHPAAPPAVPTRYSLDSGLPPGFISQFAFKQFPEPNGGRGLSLENDAYFLTDENGVLVFPPGSNVPIGFFTVPFTGPPVPLTMNFRRDGYILRLRELLPLISSMVLAPSPIPGGDPQGLANPPASVGTINLSGPAPAGGATINLTLDNGAAASFLQTSDAATSTFIIPAGSSTGTFNVYSKVVVAPANVQVKANYAGNQKTATMQIVPWLATLTINGASIVGGNTTTATVKLNGIAPAGGVDVAISTDLPGQVTFPGGNVVNVPQGSNTATFTISTNGVDVAATATINATLLGVTRSGALGINIARLTTITLAPNPVAAGGSVTGFVNLDGKTGIAGTLNISINGNPAGYVISPITVTIPANSNQSGQFTIQIPFEPADIGRVVKAVRVNGANVVIDGPVTSTLNVQALTVSSITLNPDTIPSGGSSVATVTIPSAAPTGGARIQVSSNKPGIAIPVDINGVPISEVIIPAGSTTVDFAVKGLFALNGDEDVLITAVRGPTTPRTATLKVLALTYTMTITPSSVFGGQGATGKITLSAPAISGFAMNTITCDVAGVVITQPVFTVGNPVATFAIATPVVADTVTATFTANAGTLPPVFATLVIKATEVIGIKILPKNTVRQNSTIQIQVTVNRNVTVATPGKITFTNATLLNMVGNVKTFTIPIGQNMTTITMTTRRIPRNLSTQVTATVSPSGTGASVSTTLFVII